MNWRLVILGTLIVVSGVAFWTALVLFIIHLI